MTRAAEPGGLIDTIESVRYVPAPEPAAPLVEILARIAKRAYTCERLGIDPASYPWLMENCDLRVPGRTTARVL
jgi:hypothetical protein